ncbi:MAG: hypothetical protein M5U33_01760 [Pseudorhodoplanes sp.]|nr:hypothetical protein [Pseudorhodoplanes sp.]
MSGRFTENPIGDVGFEQPRRRDRALTARRLAFTQLIMTASLLISIVIAATAVSIGIARADTLAVPAGPSALPVATMLGALLVLMGAITAAFAGRPDQTTQRD